jgi:hypothetical protein
MRRAGRCRAGRSCAPDALKLGYRAAVRAYLAALA